MYQNTRLFPLAASGTMGESASTTSDEGEVAELNDIKQDYARTY